MHVQQNAEFRRSADQRTKSSHVLETVKRVARTLAFTVLIVTSLLTFPSVVPWMIAFWLVVHTAAVCRGRPGWLPLLVIVGVLIAKQIFWAPSVIVFAGVALLDAVLLWTRSFRGAAPKGLIWTGLLCVWIAWTAVTIEWHAIAHCSHSVKMDPNRAVVCVGNSLTSGLLPDRGYPDQLRKMIRLPVVNLGQSGITTEGGLDMLPRLKKANPRVVVIELGGHDFLKGRDRRTTKANLEKLIAACRQMGAEVILMEIPRGFMTDPFRGLEREIAYETDVELIPDSGIRRLVLFSPISPPGMWMRAYRLSDDGIHSNARGSEVLARYAVASLERLFGDCVRRDTNGH
jgi:lysophospholipase L1-like esterase